MQVYQNILPETAAIVAAVRESLNPCAVPVFFQTWGQSRSNKAMSVKSGMDDLDT